MKVKAVIWRKDRTNDVVILGRKNRELSDITFEREKTVYVLDADRFQVTWDRPRKYLGLKRAYYSTFYYKQGQSKPVPIQQLGDNGKIPSMTVSPEELRALFTPWFYRTIAPVKPKLADQLQFYGVIGCLLLLVYIVYMLSSGSYTHPPIPAPSPAPTV